MKNTEYYSYNTTDINNLAKMHPVVYCQYFYLLKCTFLLQTGRNWVRLLLLCTCHQQKYTGCSVVYVYREQLLCQCILFILHLFGNLFEYLTMDELYFANSDVSLVDGEYNSSGSDQDQDEIRPFRFEAYLSEEGLSDNIPHTIERISNTQW